MDLLGSVEEVEEERKGEEGSEEEEPFGLGMGRFRIRGSRGEEVHARVKLGAMGWNVGGGRSRLEVGNVH